MEEEGLESATVSGPLAGPVRKEKKKSKPRGEKAESSLAKRLPLSNTFRSARDNAWETRKGEKI